MIQRGVMALLALTISLPMAAAGADIDFTRGQWLRAELEIDDQRQIPFLLWLPEGVGDAVIRNGGEDIPVDFQRSGDGITLDFPHYDSRIEAKRDGDGFVGEWRKRRSAGVAVMPFSAAPISEPSPVQRFAESAGRRAEGGESTWRRERWAMTFSRSGRALGLLAVQEQRTTDAPAWRTVRGTIQTPTGDYRFLSGAHSHNRGSPKLLLSVFDGAHAFLFTARYDSSRRRMTGEFHSGNWWRETFTAQRLDDDEAFELPDPFSEVAITSADGRLHLDALDDPRYQGKPVIVQIFGTWCPNCHDEAPVLVDLHRRFHAEGLEMLSLAYEVTGDDARSRRQVERFKEKYGIDWEILVAGTSDKDHASRTLPDLSRVKSFPTTIWIGRDGVVRAVHSGFAGPATGATHERLLDEFERLTREIVRQ